METNAILFILFVCLCFLFSQLTETYRDDGVALIEQLSES